jgi:hypothetical protein
MSRSITQACLLPAAVLAVLAVAPPARAQTTIEGYSSFVAETRTSSIDDPTWELSNPQLYAELSLRSTPLMDLEAFLKLWSESNRWVRLADTDVKETLLFLREGHMRYRWSNLEGHLFFGQNRFWLNEPLLDIVNPDVVKHDNFGPRAQGIRLDFWDVYTLSGAAFISERSDYFTRAYDEIPESEQSYYPGMAPGDTITGRTDDYRAFRVTGAFPKRRGFYGVTYGRKDYIRYSDGLYHGRSIDYDETIAADLELALGELWSPLARFGRVTWLSEYGRNISGWLSALEDPQPNGFKTEIRDFGIGNAWRFIGSYEKYGAEFYTDGLASGNRRDLNDYSRLYLEARYRVPVEAINVTGWVTHAEPEHPGLTSYSQTVGTIDEWGVWTYIEFLHGFTGTAEYKVYQDKNGTWPALFFEVTGENRLVRLRSQFAIKDIDSPYEILAFAFEANVNLTDRWKFYSRVMNVDEKTESRQTAFMQLRYLGWQGAEFFIEFGNEGHSNDLTRDGDFVNRDSSSTTELVFKTFLRIYY